MTYPLSSSAKAAAEAVVALVQNTLDMPASDVQGAVSDIILRHVEPIVRAVEAELRLLDEAQAGWRGALEARDQALAKLAEVEAARTKETNVTRDATELMYAAEKRAQKYMHERDTALSRLAQSDALLREALIHIGQAGTADGTDLPDRISAHLATATTKEGKTP